MQAGAFDGGAPSYEGRDNANQIALNDGIPPITNQYLFQPISGSFYAACSDGDFDTSVFGHEYTHLISNRMVGGPDDSLTGAQAGAMGESWSDLDALEYLHEYGYVPQDGANPWAEGPYVTGNKQRGIRNYPLNNNPLNYSDIGYDENRPGGARRRRGLERGELQHPAGARREVRPRVPGSRTAALQMRAPTACCLRTRCPGNRRWIQLMYDGWLMQPRRRQHARRSRQLPRRGHDALPRRQPGDAVDSFARRGFGKPQHQRHRRRQPEAELRGEGRVARWNDRVTVRGWTSPGADLPA